MPREEHDVTETGVSGADGGEGSRIPGPQAAGWGLDSGFCASRPHPACCGNRKACGPSLLLPRPQEGWRPRGRRLPSSVLLSLHGDADPVGSAAPLQDAKGAVAVGAPHPALPGPLPTAHPWRSAPQRGGTGGAQVPSGALPGDKEGGIPGLPLAEASSQRRCWGGGVSTRSPRG